MSQNISQLARACRQASHHVARLNSHQKNKTLHDMANYVLAEKKAILAANKKDIEKAKENGIPDAMMDRLVLNEQRLTGMAHALKDVASLNDPVGTIDNVRTRPNGIQVGQMRIPLGVISIIYE